MESWALFILKSLAGLIVVTVILIVCRTFLRIFQKSKTFSIGFFIAIFVGILYYLFSKSVLLSAVLSSIIAAILYLVWLITAYIRDRRIWAKCKSEDTFKAYSDYLKLDTKRFKISVARNLARKRMKEQIAFFTLLRHTTKLPVGSIPLALGNVVVQGAVTESTCLVLEVKRKVDELSSAYLTVLKNREKENLNFVEWKNVLKRIKQAQNKKNDIPDYDARLATAEKQVKIHEQLIKRHHYLLNPEKELSNKALQMIESRLESVIQRAFNFIIPSELLKVQMVSKSTSEFSSDHLRMVLDYRIKPIEIGTLIQQSEPPKYFSYIKSEYEWKAILKGAGSDISDTFRIPEPQGYTNKYGIKKTYAYLIVRGYADFAWELLRGMGFVGKERFDSEESATKIGNGNMQELFKKFRSELDGALEGGIIEIASSVSVAKWLQQNESELKVLSKSIEDNLSRELNEFFSNSLDILSSILVVPEMDLSSD